MSSDLWKIARLGDIADVVMGQSPKSKYYNNTGKGLPFLQGNRTFGDKHPLFDTYCTNGNKFANPNDVLLSVRAPVGDLNITKVRVCIGRGLSSLCMKNGNNEYLYYLLKANINELINRESGTVYGSINRNDIIDFEVFVIDSDKKQLEISDILSTLDDKIELNRQTNATLEAIAQAIFKEWFVDFNYPSATGEMVDSELGPIPKGWRVRKLGDILDINGGATPSTKVKEYWNGENWFVTPKDLSSLESPFLLKTDRKITSKGVGQISTGILPSGTLLLSSRAPIGYLAISCIPVSINQGFIAINSKESSNLFMLLWLKNNMDMVISRANGSTFLEISKSNFREIELLLPDKRNLKLFDEIILPLFENILNTEKQSITLTLLRNLLLLNMEIWIN